MKGELLKAQAFLTDKERGLLMRNYRQFNREQIYQIYALKKAGLSQIAISRIIGVHWIYKHLENVARLLADPYSWRCPINRMKKSY